jgi:hypothetical protein
MGQRFNGSYGFNTGNYSGGYIPQPNMTGLSIYNNGPGSMWTGVSVTPNFIKVRLNDSYMNALMKNLSNGTIRAKINGMLGPREFGNLSANQSGNVIFGQMIGDIRSASYIKSRLDDFKTLNFFIAQNGTLVLPMLGMMPGPGPRGLGHIVPPVAIGPDSGYNLSAGGTATLRYSGSLSLGNGRLGIEFKPGQTYEIIVTGTGCASATMNVTAS